MTRVWSAPLQSTLGEAHSYLTSGEMISRAMMATSEALDMRLGETERAEAHELDRQMVKRILTAHRDLSANGFWCRRGLQSREAFNAERIAMMEGERSAEFRRALSFLLLCATRRKTINQNMTSYGLKHMVERFMSELKAPGIYCCNGTFIIAALGLGYTAKRIEGTPNCWFNISVSQGACR